jgi:intraflagellar transport protein 88
MNNNPYMRGFGSGPKQPDNNEDDLYGGFHEMNAQHEMIANTVAAATQGLGQASQRVGFSGDFGFNQTGGGMPMRPPTQYASQPGGDRPRTGMNSVRGAGFTSHGKPASERQVFDPFHQSAQGPPPPLVQKTDNSPENQAKAMELQVNTLLEESAKANVDGKALVALEKAKQAIKKERALCKHREKHEHGDQINMDLTCAVLFNLANQYHANGMHVEAIQAYGTVVKRKEYLHAGRLRVNMGNIFFEQKKYQNAIKMYKMAMDQIGNQSRAMKYQIMRNIGIAFVQMRQFPNAIQSFETIMEHCPDPQSGFNLILCYYAIGDKENMKTGFRNLLAVPQASDEQEDEDDEDSKEDMFRHDDLKRDRNARRKKLNRYVFQAAKLLAPVIEQDFAAGYDWVIEFLKQPRAPQSSTSVKQGFAKIAMEMEIAKGIAFLKRKNINAAIEVFKSFENKDAGMIDHAATNLSFLFYLEGDMKNAEKYAEVAVKAVHYDAKAHVNKANFLVHEGELEKAKDLYLEAIGVEEDCVEAIYNLGVIEKRIGNLDDALEAFKQLHKMVPEDAQVVYQIANLYEMLNENNSAAEWFKILHGAVPTDPKVLARLAQLHSNENDDAQAFHHYMDSYNVYPVNMEVIAWLGVWYVKNQVYVEALQFFQRAAEIEPTDVKWQLMVASCYRRMGNFPLALELYKKIHKQDPDNIECLRYLVAICKDMNDSALGTYNKLLRSAEREQEQRNCYMQQAEMNDPNNHDGYNVGQVSPGGARGTPLSSPRDRQDHIPPTPGLKTPSKNLNQSFDNSLKLNARANGTMLNSGRDAEDDDMLDDDDMDELLPI